MLDLKQWVARLNSIWYDLKTDRLQWRVNNHAQQMHLKQQQVLQGYQLASELKMRRVQLQHELALLKTEHSLQLTMLKTKCEQDLKDYKQYLQALDQLKIVIQNSYKQLPEVIVFTIHHHAKQLLNRMWEARSLDDKVHHEIELIQFMTTLHEEARGFALGESRQQRPEKTLQLLQRSPLIKEKV